MEGIFYRNEVDDNTNGIYFVEELYLYSLQKFVGFLVQKDSNTDGIHVDVDHSLRRFEVVSNNEASTSASNGNFRPFSTNESISRFNEDCSNNDEHQQFVSDKQVLLVKDKDILIHSEMHCAFSPEVMNERLVKLRKLRIAFCDALEVIFLFEARYPANVRILNTLEELELYGLQNLKHIWYQIPQNAIVFRMLQLLTLSECQNSYLLTITMAKLLVRLRKIQISRCEKMEEIVARDGEKEVEENMDETILPRLKVLELKQMSNLKIFCRANHAIELPLLEYLKLNECNKMECFSYGSFETPMLEKVGIDGRWYPLVENLNAALMRLS